MEDSELYVCLEDNGVGIKDNQIANLFKVGENISTSGTNKEQGTGPGLILCKEFIEKHGGRIWIERKAERGSRFCFLIPAVQL